ncbi:hypothetical protein DMA11_04005 [Marinilabiliaceae bacterium JC017]|nr:hypothetical protein DMA11_04005 [Marinilabiliaceae bacterium JC017]
MRKHPHYPQINVGREENVVFYEVKGQLLVRSYSHPANPRTEKQQRNRLLHARLNSISSQNKLLRHFCFGGIPTYKNSHNAFISLHKLFFIEAGMSLDEKLLPCLLHWSLGSCPGAEELIVERKNEFILRWHPGSLTRRSDELSQAVYVVWNSDRNSWQWNANAGHRGDGMCYLNLPQNWQADQWVVWLYFRDATTRVCTMDRQIIVSANVSGVQVMYDRQAEDRWELFHDIGLRIIKEREEKMGY